MSPLSRVGKVLGDVRNESSEAMEVLADAIATLTVQVIPLLGQASL